MAIALVRETHVYYSVSNDRSSNFPTAVPAGRLLIVYADKFEGTTPPAAPAGWTTVFSQYPYEGNKSPGVLFAKISDGSTADGGTDGSVGPFTPADRLLSSEWSGATSVVVAETDINSVDLFTGSSSETRTTSVTPPTGGLALMVMHDKAFGAVLTMAAGGSSTLLWSENDIGMVYRLGGGSLTNQIDETGTAARWSINAGAAFGGVGDLQLSGNFGYILA